MKRVFYLVLILMLAVSSNASAVTLSFNHQGPIEHPYQDGAAKFAELVDAYTDGSLEIAIYPSSQIASGAQSIDFVQMGLLDITLQSTMAMSNFVPEFGVLDMPFLFKTREEAFRVLDGEVGAALSKLAEEKGLKILAWWDNGFRSFTSSKGPIEKPEDLRGLRIRSPESQVYLTTFQALGAVPIQITGSGAFTALRLKIVDAQDNSSSNNLTAITTNSMFLEICPYYSVTNHIYSAEPLIMSLDRFNSFTASEQEALMKAAKAAETFERQASIARDKDIFQTIINAGAIVNVVEDTSAFVQACKPVYDLYADEFGDLLAMIRTTIAQ